MIGQSLKHYKIEQALGKGGMGVVYRARDLKLRRPVALKVLSAELTADHERRRRFLQEARSAARITHPAIAQVYDVDEQEGVTFIAMELVEGKTARQLITGRELDLLGAIDIAIQVAEGLAKAHQAGIVHRDIKSDNIILTPDGHAKILDFGLAKLLDPVSESGNGNQDLSEMQTAAHTQVGVVMGTVAYMSPEQARGRQVDYRSDLFSLGIMLYEMATGQLPFQGGTPLDTMHAIAFEETRPMTSIRHNLPPDLQRIVSRCLRKRPEDRYPSATALAEELRALRRNTESGKSHALSLGDRVRDRIETLRQLRPSDYVWYLAGAAGLVLVLYLVSSEGRLGGVLVVGIAGLFLYRTIRNRRPRMLRRFVRKTSKIREVRLVAIREDQATVVVDRALPRLYRQINEFMGAANKKLFFGNPLVVAIRDDLAGDELRRLLSGPGVFYVRDDVLEARKEREH